jgi:hypothetical protein
MDETAENIRSSDRISPGRSRMSLHCFRTKDGAAIDSGRF